MSDWYAAPVKAPCEKSRQAARDHQSRLTKPPGSLGQLEWLAEQFAAWQSNEKPELQRIAVRIFAADHGVSAQGVSAFPAEVTVQMVQNFIAGGAAISVLARDLEADFAVVNVGTFNAVPPAPGLVDARVAAGTADFSEQVAMSAEQLSEALWVGKTQIDGLEADVFVGGEMGIANTTSAAAVLAALEGLSAAQAAGRGTGVDDQGLAHKISVIDQSLDRHKALMGDWQGVMQAVGGFEIAALAGAYIRCAQRGIPALVDGFIATVAALVACRANADVRPWLMASHQSAEAGHKHALDALGMTALLSLGMRLGEGSGAAVAVPLIQSALKLHAHMATFDDAGVSASH